MRTELYQGLSSLPVFVPDLAPVPLEVVDLLARISDADAVLFATPEYAGGLPGALKNLLDWTVGGGQLYDKLVAWLDVANPGRGEVPATSSGRCSATSPPGSWSRRASTSTLTVTADR